MLKKTYFFLLTVFKPLFEKFLLSDHNKILQYQFAEKSQDASGMVTEFNIWQKLIFQPLFKRVQITKTDIARMKTLSQSGPVVFVMKNRGQLEYRYFNYLFLRERLEPICFANNVTTVWWRPLSKIWQFSLARLSEYYADPKNFAVSESEKLVTMIEQRKNVLINLSISRDYIFGLFNTNPLAKVAPLLDAQNQSAQNIHIVPLQFLYDKQPEKAEKSFSDLLFGEKSRPGALRKTFLFFTSLRANPQVKFGTEINLKEFIAAQPESTSATHTEKLYQKIEETLAIEHARITGPKLKSKETLINDILNDKAFNDAASNLGHELGESVGSIKDKIKRYLNEIAADVNYSYVQFSYLVLNYVWTHIFDGLVIKHDQLNKIREVAGKNPVVLVPMHRSHIDYLLISHIFYSNNITFPHVCAGINMNFWPVGRIIRKCGGFFIRRRLEGNLLYKESLYAYIKTLMDQGYCMEFFIEGTRSRTGKMLKPKMGVLSQIMRAFVEGKRDDIYFVPIAVNYDQLIEQKSYQSEAAGHEKAREDAGELLKVRKIFNKKYGKVYVEFAEPISLREFLGRKGLSKNSSLSEIKPEVTEFAYYLTYQMNKVAIVTPIALVATAVLTFGKKHFSFEELLQNINALKRYLDYKKVTYSDLIHYSDRWAYSEALQILQTRGFLKEIKTFEETFYTLEPQHRSQLDFYKNNILHFFISLSCFCKILAAIPNGSTVSLELVIKKYETFKKLFVNDFTFSARVSIEAHLHRVLVFMAECGMIQSANDFATFTKTLNPSHQGDFDLYSRLVDNFLESHLVALRYLKLNRFESTDAKVLMKDILEKSKPLYLKDDLKYPEAANRFNLENSIKFCSDVGLVQTQNKDSKITYTTTHDADLITSWIDTIQSFLTTTSPADKVLIEPETLLNTSSAAEEGLH